MAEVQTEVDLLRLAITAKTVTQEAFAKMLGMTRQNLNRIIREAEKNGGRLNPKFVDKLKRMYGVDIYVWKMNPTNDVHSQTEHESMQRLMYAAEDAAPYSKDKIIEHLITENTDLRKRLEDCERKFGEKKDGRRSA